MESVGDYDFTQDWFEWAVPVWTKLFTNLPKDRKRDMLEIGSYEGRSAVWLIENALADNGLLHCIDTWEGGEEHKAQGIDMGEVEAKFDFNIESAKAVNPTVQVFKYKDFSYRALGALASKYNNSFDFIYIDGSHQAADVLSDACMAFNLLRVGAYMCFDDYLWDTRIPQLQRPKMAIDAFVTIFEPRIRIAHIGYQYIIQRMA